MEAKVCISDYEKFKSIINKLIENREGILDLSTKQQTFVIRGSLMGWLKEYSFDMPKDTLGYFRYINKATIKLILQDHCGVLVSPEELIYEES